MTHSISDAFRRRADRGQAALVPYVTAGFPGPEDTVPVLAALAEAGAEVIELGVPFSDPLADGPTIQRSSFRSLEAGTTVERVLEAVRGFRADHDTPLVLFSYLNPILRYGTDRFLETAAEAGAQGVLVTDLPTGADPELESKISDSPLDLIRLVAPTTPARRIAAVARGGRGFVYYISRTGVTGARTELSATLADEVAVVKDAVELPVAVGFGISTPEQAALVAGVADGVVVGSALVETLDQGGIDAGREFVAGLRAGMDG